MDGNSEVEFTLEGSPLPRELIFLVSAPPPGSEFEAGVPCRVKTTNTAERNPLIAFVSEELGRQLIAGRRMNGEVSLLPLSKLSSEQAQKLMRQNVLLFENSEQVARYLEQGEKFDFERLVVSFEDATRILPTAL